MGELGESRSSGILSQLWWRPRHCGTVGNESRVRPKGSSPPERPGRLLSHLGSSRDYTRLICSFPRADLRYVTALERRRKHANGPTAALRPHALLCATFGPAWH